MSCSARLRAGLVLLAACQGARPAAPAGIPVAPPAPAPVPPPPQPAALDGSQEWTEEELRLVLSLSPLPEPPDDPTNAYDTDPAAARLGQFLFYNPRLSGDGTVSCSSCHLPEQQWTDGRSLASVRQPLERHALTLWNAAYQRWYFWDGRADSLWSQALHPLEDPREHAGDRVGYARLVATDAELRAAYERIFGPLPDLEDAQRFPPAARPIAGQPEHPQARAWAAMDPVDQDQVNRVFANLGKALAAFQRQLVSRAAPFDRFVAGVRSADARLQAEYPPAARRGLKLFVGKARCVLCHSGPLLSDREFHNNRLPSRRDLPEDLGRFQGIRTLLESPFKGTGPYSDARSEAQRRAAEDKVDYLALGRVWGEFRTPSLRNVAVTPPYGHQGQFASLGEVLDFYSELVSDPPIGGHVETILVPLHLAPGEKADLEAFLETLTDTDLPAHLRQPLANP